MRYGLAVMAPSFVSLAHLVVQLAMLSHVSAAEFGTFAFLMILVQFGYGLSNALISTPYDVHVSRGSSDEAARRTLLVGNLVFALVVGLACLGVGGLLGAGSWIAVFALFATLSMIRWFGRVFNYVRLRPTAAALSDIVYSLVLIALAMLLVYGDRLDGLSISLAFTVATLVALASLGGDFLRAQFGGLRGASLRPYARIWRDQSRWTVLGVTTTEFTSNIHSYLVTLLAGPARFAPISASALFMRPALLSITALTQLERPAIGRALAAGDTGTALATKRRFLLALLCGWVGTLVLAALVIRFRPGLVIKPGFDASEIHLALVLLSAITLIQIWQAPNSLLLQSLGHFRDLSTASIWSCAVSVVGVLAILLVLPPVWSLVGIAIGQFVMAWRLSALVAAWNRGCKGEPAAEPTPAPLPKAAR